MTLKSHKFIQVSALLDHLHAHTSDIRPNSEKITRNEERVFLLKQTHFCVNNDMQQRGNTFSYYLPQCDGFTKRTIA
jgi:hypothetical protein